MRVMRFRGELVAPLLAALFVFAAWTPGTTRGAEEAAAPAAGAAGEDWYYRAPPAREEQPTIAQQRSALRASQRMARLDSMRWYGYYGSRPTATAMAFTSMYSPAWQMPGGRPFAWYRVGRPIVVINGANAFYR